MSEIKPLRIEERLTDIGTAVDDLTGVEGKTTTTVALDFGRITVSSEVVLYLFGTPGQDRFWFMWRELSLGAIGAVVLAHTRRMDDCFAAVDFFDSRGIPFVLAVNVFQDSEDYDDEEIRSAADLSPDVPIQFCDAGDRESAKLVLIRLLEHVMSNPVRYVGG